MGLRTLGQSFIVENMAGASGIVAHQAGARAAPDGYTFLCANTSGMAIDLVSFRQLPYDPTRDFGPSRWCAVTGRRCCP